MSDRANAVVKVKVEILDPDDKLFPELAATVHFLRASRSTARTRAARYLFVPKSAVFREDGHDFVWVIREDNTLRKQSGRGRYRRPTTRLGSSRDSN